MSDAVIPAGLGRVTVEEIASQPRCWARAGAQARAGVVGLPGVGERVLVLGCGTSFFVAAAYGWLREQAGQGVTDALVASELPGVLRDYDRVVAISRSGTTTEVLQALGRLGGAVAVTAIVGVLESPIARAASEVVDVSYADEVSVVQTRFPTSLLTLLRAHLGESEVGVAGLIGRVREVMTAAVREPAPAQLVVLGSGWAAPLAQEAALKCRESAGMWAEAYPSGEYLHGPISVAGPGTLVWAMTPLTGVQTRAISATGARVHQGHDDPQVELVALQRHAVAWAVAAGRDPDRPIHLTRSVITA